MFDVQKHAVTLATQPRVQGMDESCFQDLVDRFGDDLSTWPIADGFKAQALLAHSAGARAILDDACRLRQIFAVLPTPSAPADLASRLLALTERCDDKLT